MGRDAFCVCVIFVLTGKTLLKSAVFILHYVISSRDTDPSLGMNGLSNVNGYNFLNTNYQPEGVLKVKK